MTAAQAPEHQAQADAVAPDAVVGAPIFSRDGHRLGRVKEARDRCLLVDVRFAFDYWISLKAVAGIRAGRVLLGVDRHEVEQYLVDIDCLDDFDDLPAVRGVDGAVPLAVAV